MLSSRLLVIGLLVLVASTKDKAPPPERPSADTLYVRGLTLIGSGDYKGAEKTANQGLREYPEANGFHFLLGETRYFGNSIAEAYYQYSWEIARVGNRDQKGMASAKRIGEIVQNNKSTEADEVREVVNALGKMMTDPKAALATIRTLEKTRGARFSLKLYEAEALYADNDLKGAEPVYRELLHLDPTFVGGYVELSGVLNKSGNQKEANLLLAKARTIDPDNWQLQLPK